MVGRWHMGHHWVGGTQGLMLSVLSCTPQATCGQGKDGARPWVAGRVALGCGGNVWLWHPWVLSCCRATILLWGLVSCCWSWSLCGDISAGQSSWWRGARGKSRPVHAHGHGRVSSLLRKPSQACAALMVLAPCEDNHPLLPRWLSPADHGWKATQGQRCLPCPIPNLGCSHQAEGRACGCGLAWGHAGDIEGGSSMQGKGVAAGASSTGVGVGMLPVQLSAPVTTDGGSGLSWTMVGSQPLPLPPCAHTARALECARPPPARQDARPGLCRR